MSQRATVDETLARKVLTVVDTGLVHGLGKPIPGQMCVEAAVNYAMGLPHGDTPSCVGAAVRAFKIRLNDSTWSSNTARTAGMRKLAIAQLGSDTIDQIAFARWVAKACIQQILPMALRSAASCNPKFADQLEQAARTCEREGTADSARDAQKVARSAADAAYAASAAYAADAASAASAASAAYAADAADAASAASAASAAYAASAADAADAASAADAAYAARDRVLNAVAKVGLDALIALNSPGCAYLWLCEAVQP